MENIKLVLDLKKSELNTAKLVKKPILVRGKDGKVFTRMQWVSPGELPKADRHKKVEDKKDKKPRMKLKPAKPEITPEEAEETLAKLKEFLGKKDALKEKQVAEKEVIKRGEDPISTESDITTKEFVRKYSRDSSIEYLIQRNVVPVDLEKYRVTANHKAMLNKLGVQFSARDLEAATADKIKTSTHDIMAKRAQMQALKDGRMRHNMSMASHPDIAKAVVDKIVGREIAESFRRDMKDANLTINFPTKNVDGIRENGYVASTAESYVRDNAIGGVQGMDKYKEILNGDYDSEEERIQAFRDVGGQDEDWGGETFFDVYVRAKAEHEALGMKMSDEKPTYIAFNPMNNPSGGAVGYGARHLKITDPSVLRHSTMTMDDSFFDTRAFAKIWSMEHLKDIFILKAIEKYDGDITKSYEEGSLPWYSRMGDIPLELQYHKGELSPKQFEIENTIDEDKEMLSSEAFAEKYGSNEDENYDLDFSDDELNDLEDIDWDAEEEALLEMEDGEEY